MTICGSDLAQKRFQPILFLNNWDKVGNITEGMTAADMEKVAEEAARNAMH
jgi:SpoVK/Ycf46/Vps4 family AAA+-type ATPase